MDLVTAALRPLAAERAPWLRGTLRIPGDKSISHHALMLGAMARGETIIDGLLESDGVLRTALAMRALGARLDRRAGRWHVTGLGVGGFLEPEQALDFAGSGTGLCLAMGLVGSHDLPSRFTGDAALSSRPLRHLLEPLREIGVHVLDHYDNRLPVTLRGPRTPVPIAYRLPVASAQVKSCLLLAGLVMPGTTSVSEPVKTRDHTERMLAAFGAEVQSSIDGAGNHVIEVEGLPDLRAQHVLVPGDPALAALGIVAGLIVPGSELVIENVLVNPTRAGLFDTLREMGGDIELLDVRTYGGEPVADLRVRHSELKGVNVPAGRAPAMIDCYLALAIAASFAHGTTTMAGLGALRSGPSDRLAALARGLRCNGVVCTEGEDVLAVEGSGRVMGGGRVVTGMDHRIATSFLVMGMAADDAVTIDDQSALALGFADFVASFEDVGASFIRYSE